MEYYLELRQAFRLERQQATCLLILEHTDTPVTEELRSYFVSSIL
jgi:hypothetical protein